jgi:hypothetical protein
LPVLTCQPMLRLLWAHVNLLPASERELQSHWRAKGFILMMNRQWISGQLIFISNPIFISISCGQSKGKTKRIDWPFTWNDWKLADEEYTADHHLLINPPSAVIFPFFYDYDSRWWRIKDQEMIGGQLEAADLRSPPSNPPAHSISNCQFSYFLMIKWKEFINHKNENWQWNECGTGGL